jgi:hypothetical protein
MGQCGRAVASDTPLMGRGAGDLRDSSGRRIAELTCTRPGDGQLQDVLIVESCPALNIGLGTRSSPGSGRPTSSGVAP